MFIFLVTCVRASIAWPEVSTMNSKLIPAYLLFVKAFPIKRYLFRSWFRVCWRYPECQAFLCGKVDERREMKVLSLRSTLPKPPGEDLVPVGYRGYNCSWRRKKPRGYSNPCCSAYTDTWTTEKLSFARLHITDSTTKNFPHSLIGISLTASVVFVQDP